MTFDTANYGLSMGCKKRKDSRVKESYTSALPFHSTPLNLNAMDFLQIDSITN